MSALPVNRFWIVVLGLLGRYSARPDEGKLRRSHGINVIGSDRSNFDAHRQLTGTTGRLCCERLSTGVLASHIFFTLYHAQELGDPVPDRPACSEIAALIWLSLGCMRVADNKVYDLSGTIDIHQTTRWEDNRGPSPYLYDFILSDDSFVDPSYRDWFANLGELVKSIFRLVLRKPSPAQRETTRLEGVMERYYWRHRRLPPGRHLAFRKRKQYLQDLARAKWIRLDKYQYIPRDNAFEIAYALSSSIVSSLGYLFDAHGAWQMHSFLAQAAVAVVHEQNEQEPLSTPTVMKEFLEATTPNRLIDEGVKGGLSELKEQASRYSWRRRQPGTRLYSGYWPFSRQGAGKLERCDRSLDSQIKTAVQLELAKFFGVAFICLKSSARSTSLSSEKWTTENHSRDGMQHWTWTTHP